MAKLTEKEIEEIYDNWKDVIEDTQNKIVYYAKKNGANNNIKLIKKAMKKANELHYGAVRLFERKPYILHPLEVALSLAELNFDTDIIISAIMHDTIEDCKYTKEDLKNDFGGRIAEIVDAVTEINQNEFDDKNINKGLYSQSNCAHSTMDELTYSKLLARTKKYPEAIYIKAADRINNFKTLSSFSENKRKDKVRETKEKVLPLCKELKTVYFYDYLTNDCFSFDQEKYILNFRKVYNREHELTKINYEMMLKHLKEHLKNITKARTAKIIGQELKEYEIADYLKEYYGLENFADILEYSFQKMPLYAIYVIEDEINELERFDFVLYNRSEYFKFYDIGFDSLTNNKYLVLIDNNGIMFKVYHMTKEEYHKYLYGDINEYKNVIDDINSYMIQRTIMVYDDHDCLIKIPEKSTVLDFALLTKEKEGLCFDYAEINIKKELSGNEKNRKSAFTRLYPYDKVRIFTAKNSKGEMVETANIKSLTFVNTQQAKEILVKYLEKKYLKK